MNNLTWVILIQTQENPQMMVRLLTRKNTKLRRGPPPVFINTLLGSVCQRWGWGEVKAIYTLVLIGLDLFT